MAKAAPPHVDQWQAQNLRLIVFPEDPKAALQRDWWRELTGTDPDSSVRKKIEREDAGIHAGDMLVASVDPTRLQWTMTRAADPETIIDGAPLLGRYTEKKDEFLALMTKWLPSCPPVRRIAFVASLLQEGADRDQTYRLLDCYLRYVEVHPESSDLIYRVNRRRASTSGVAGMTINGLATWSSVKIITSLAVSAAEGPKTDFGRTTKNYCALELDMNTNPDFSGTLPAEQLPGILLELAGVATDIATRGDVRVG